MTPAETLRVELGPRSYDIVIGEGLLAGAGRLIAPFAAGAPVIVVTDETVRPLYLAPLEASLDAGNVAHRRIVVPAGEGSKDFAEFGRLLDSILETRPERGSLLIALGGGVVGDLAGFAASVTLRGIDFVQIPTTLLAQVDSSVGGKTGINSGHGKNLIGAFHQPRLVIADTATLATLPPREMRAGYAEIVKYGLIGDRAFFEWLEAHGPAVCSGDAEAARHAIRTSCAAKADIVAGDERERGARALLNLGHTFGHALEAETGYGDALLHGEAVAIGLVLAFDLSVQLGLCAAADASRVRRHLSRMGLPTAPDEIGAGALDADSLVAHMFHDKKVRGGKLTFVLSRGIGSAFVATDIDPAEVGRLLRRVLAA